MEEREDYIKSLEEENKYLKEQLKVKESEVDEFRKLAMNLGNKVMEDENISEKDIADRLRKANENLYK